MKSFLPRSLILLVFLFSSSVSFSQNFTERPEFIKSNSWWMFKGEPESFVQKSYILDLNSQPPVVHPIPLIGNMGYSAVGDPETGDLLFYTDSETLWNKDFQQMPNGDGLSATGTSRQGSCVVPVIDSPGKFYVFTIPDVPLFGLSNCDLRYSIVDMSLESGLGDVVPGQKNILLDNGPLGDMMIAIPGNNCDVWLVVHTQNDPIFKAYHITKDGIDPSPVISNTSTSLSGIGAYVSGAMAVSPDRSKIALASMGELFCFSLGYYSSSAGGTLIAEFNPSNGEVFNDIKLSDSVGMATCFSSNSKLLYTSDLSAHMATYGADGDSGWIYQYDVSNFPNITLSYSEMLHEAAGSHFRRTTQGVIVDGVKFRYFANPNMVGPACTYTHTPYTGLGTLIDSIPYTNMMGNDVIYPLPPDTTYSRQDTFFCKNEPIQLTASTAYDGKYLWEDGNQSPSRSINTSGIYWVSYKTDFCMVHVDTYYVVEIDPSVSLGSDTVICEFESFTIEPDASSERLSYSWQDGTTENFYSADHSGIYWVETSQRGCLSSDTVKVTFAWEFQPDLGPDTAICKGDPINILLSAPHHEHAFYTWNRGNSENTFRVTDTGWYALRLTIPPCILTDSVHVDEAICECLIQIPNAFTPNGDGQNDLFSPVIEPGCEIKNYSLSIYNRFGQMVYKGHTSETGWDGKFMGGHAEVGTYMYMLSFKGGTRQIDYKKKGEFILLR